MTFNATTLKNGNGAAKKQSLALIAPRACAVASVARKVKRDNTWHRGRVDA